MGNILRILLSHAAQFHKVFKIHFSGRTRIRMPHVINGHRLLNWLCLTACRLWSRARDDCTHEGTLDAIALLPSDLIAGVG